MSNILTNTISFLGKRYRLKMIKDKMSSTMISENLKLIVFHVTDKRKYKNDIREWYEIETAKIIAKRLPLIASKLNIEYNTFSIKRQKSRWGSCSIKRNLCFNLLLSATPIEVIDYVITHELLHIIEPNHSKNFWNLMKSTYPNYQKHREWLNTYSSLINNIPTIDNKVE
jgi:predicted metal-dependent hydrolase